MIFECTFLVKSIKEFKRNFLYAIERKTVNLFLTPSLLKKIQKSINRITPTVPVTKWKNR